MSRKENRHLGRRFSIEMPWRTATFVALWFTFCWNYRFDDPTKDTLRDVLGTVIAFIGPW